MLLMLFVSSLAEYDTGIRVYARVRKLKFTVPQVLTIVIEKYGVEDINLIRLPTCVHRCLVTHRCYCIRN